MKPMVDCIISSFFVVGTTLLDGARMVNLRLSMSILLLQSHHKIHFYASSFGSVKVALPSVILLSS